MTRPKGYFITGTGTGVGKTFVTCSLARLGRELGRRVLAFKPIETGCARVNGQLVGADQELLCEAAGGWQQGLLRGVHQFELPVAPLVAAEAAHTPIDLVAIETTLQDGMAIANLVLVEGAGGWRVPVTRQLDMGGLALSLGFPVVVVGLATLGTINHSLLTLEAIERDGQRVAALILSKKPDDDAAQAADNARRIAERWMGTILIHSTPQDLNTLV
jgi:dethiobiotin synthetase